jgi:hypothetical protein
MLVLFPSPSVTHHQYIDRPSIFKRMLDIFATSKGKGRTHIRKHERCDRLSSGAFCRRAPGLWSPLSIFLAIANLLQSPQTTRPRIDTMRSLHPQPQWARLILARLPPLVGFAIPAGRRRRFRHTSPPINSTIGAQRSPRGWLNRSVSIPKLPQRGRGALRQGSAASPLDG